jgi:hypothetical protein
MVKALAAGAVMVAAALPVAVAGTAGAATPAPTLTCANAAIASGACISGTTVSFGTGSSGYINFTGTGFADDQNTGGAVTITSTAPGVTFSGAMETSSTTGYVAFSSTSATTPGFYNLTLTDDSGTVTLTNNVSVSTPTVTVTAAATTGNSGISGGANSTVSLTGTGMAASTVSVGYNTLATPITIVSYSDNSATSITVVVSNNPVAGAASAGSYNLVVSNGLGGGAVNVPYTVIASSSPTITAITPTVGLGIPGTGTSVQPVTLTGTHFETGAAVSLSGTGASFTTSGTSASATSVTLSSAAGVAIGDVVNGTGVPANDVITGLSGVTATLTSPTTAWLSATPLTITYSGGNTTTATSAASTTATLTVTNFAGIVAGQVVTGGGLNAAGAPYTVTTTPVSTTVTLTASVSVTQTTGAAVASTFTAPASTGTQAASAAVTVGSPAGIVPGLGVSGTNIFAGSTVSSIAGSVVTLSHVTTAPVAATLTFSGVGGETVSSVVVGSATSISFNVTVSAGASIHDDSVTILNPDSGTTTAVNALGIGQAGAALTASSGPVAPSITVTTPFGGLTPGSTSIITVTGSSTFPITTGSTVTLTLASDSSLTPLKLTGSVLAVTVGANGNYVATVKVVLPRFVSTTTTAAVLLGATSLPVADGAGIGSGPITIVDGASSEPIATVAGAVAGASTLTIPATTFAHASGVTVLFATPAAAWTVAVNDGTSTQTSSTTTLPAGNPAMTDVNGNAVTSLTPGTYSVTETVPGFGFTTGAAISFASSSGVTGSVTSASGNSAGLSITVPATTKVSATLAAAASVGQKVIQVTAAGATAPAVGATLVLDPNAILAGTDTGTVASVSGTSSPFTVTLAAGLTYNHPVGTAVTGFTTATGTATIAGTLTNGAGQIIFIPNLFGTIAAYSISAVSPATVPAGTGNVDPAGYYSANSVEFAISGGVSDTCTATTGGTTEATTCANWKVTSTNTAVTFTVLSVSGTDVFVEPTVKPGTPATAIVPVTITNGAESVSTSSAGQFGITAGPTITSITAEGTLTAGVAASDSEIIGIVGTGFSATAANDTVGFVTAAGTQDTFVNATITAATATTLTVDVTALAGATAGVDTVVVETPYPGGVQVAAPGETALFPSALTVVAPVISAATPATMPVLTAPVSPGSTATSTFTTSGFNATGTFTCGVATNPAAATPAVGPFPTCTAVFAAGSTTAVTVTFTYNGVTATPGGVLVTLTNSSQATSFPMTIVATPVISSIVVDTTVGTIANGSANVPVTIKGTGFLPGATVSIPAADGSLSGAVVTPTAITANMTLLYTAAASFTVSVTNTGGAVSQFTYGATGPTPTLVTTSAYTGLSGATGTLVLKGTSLFSGAVVSASTAGVATFGTSVASVGGTVLTIPVTYVAFAGTVPVITSLTVTNPVGQGSVSYANGLIVNPGPSVIGTYYVPTFATNVEVIVSGTGFEQGMTAASSNAAYTVALVNVNTAGTAATLLVSTTSAATVGTASTITFTNPDGGTTTFALNGGPKVVIVTAKGPKVTSFTGTPARIGKTVTFTVHGLRFGGVTVKSSNVHTTVHITFHTTTEMKISVKTSTAQKSSGTAKLAIVSSSGRQVLTYSIKK